METKRLWHISTSELATAVAQIHEPIAFDLDQTVETWQASYFRFVHSTISRFPTLVDFAAMAVFTTPAPQRPISDWAKSVAIFPLFPEQFLSTLKSARSDCLVDYSETANAPEWLSFDGEVIDAFELCDRGGNLKDIASHYIYRTTTSYYYICINHES